MQGEDQKKLDVISNEVFANCLRSRWAGWGGDACCAAAAHAAALACKQCAGLPVACYRKPPGSVPNMQSASQSAPRAHAALLLAALLLCYSAAAALALLPARRRTSRWRLRRLSAATTWWCLTRWTAPPTLMQVGAGLAAATASLFDDGCSRSNNKFRCHCKGMHLQARCAVESGVPDRNVDGAGC